MTESGNIDVVVLAGDRGPGDPLAVEAGVPGKVLVPVAGKPLLSHVMQALAEWPARGEAVLVCNDDLSYARAAAQGFEYTRADPETGPASSLASALDRLAGDRPVLIVTGDHPLLKNHWWQPLLDVLDTAESPDAIVGLVDYQQVMQRFPESRRTRYRFSDRSICGTNLFVLATRRGRRLATVWQSFERNRKQPWRIVARLGPRNLIRYALGRLSLQQAFAMLSKRLNVRVQPVLLPWPEAAVDVDTADDLKLVEQIFARRGQP